MLPFYMYYKLRWKTTKRQETKVTHWFKTSLWTLHHTTIQSLIHDKEEQDNGANMELRSIFPERGELE